jgi:hypothetical protein
MWSVSRTRCLGARIQAAQGAQFVPQAETAGQGLDGNEPGMDGVIGIGDELESQSRGSLGDGRHPSPYQVQREAFTTKNTSRPQS